MGRCDEGCSGWECVDEKGDSGGEGDGERPGPCCVVPVLVGIGQTPGAGIDIQPTGAQA